jgi:hypothetical protein
MNLADHEVILRKGLATYFVSSEGVGGKLFLTNYRLFFEPHSFNFQRRENSIRLSDIVAIEARHGDFISRKVSIYLRNKSVEEFIVYRRRIWVSEIEKAIKDSKQKTMAYMGVTTKPLLDFTPTKGQNWFVNLLIRAIIIGIFTGVLMYVFLR